MPIKSKPPKFAGGSPGKHVYLGSKLHPGSCVRCGHVKVGKGK